MDILLDISVLIKCLHLRNKLLLWKKIIRWRRDLFLCTTFSLLPSLSLWSRAKEYHAIIIVDRYQRQTPCGRDCKLQPVNVYWSVFAFSLWWCKHLSQSRAVCEVHLHSAASLALDLLLCSWLICEYVDLGLWRENGAGCTVKRKDPFLLFKSKILKFLFMVW